MGKRELLIGAGVVLVVSAELLAMPAATAHHSSAMYDDQKTEKLEGKVRLFQWTNPHCFIQILVKNPSAGEVEWSVEMGSPVQLYRGGWRPGTLKPGDAISVVIHPMRDGSAAGLFVSASGEEGRPIGQRS